MPPDTSRAQMAPGAKTVGSKPTRPSDVVAWMADHQVVTVNVAGNRESKNPGLGARVEAFLARVFTACGDAGPP
jgi:hypothetical protein